MRILLTIAEKNNWPIYNFDFVAAYLNAPLDKEVWVASLEGLKKMVKRVCWKRHSTEPSKQPDAGRSI
jgi:hypothetical protein